MPTQERTIRQERTLWGDSDAGHRLMKVIFTDDTFAFRWDVYSKLSDGQYTKAFEQWVEDRHEIEKLSSYIAIIQYGDSKIWDNLNLVLDAQKPTQPAPPKGAKSGSKSKAKGKRGKQKSAA